MRLPDLPVRAALPDLRRALRNGGNAVLVAPPGSGKTTLVPLALLDEPWLEGREILLLEPRRMAARAAAWRMADLADEPVGGLVGYRMRLESCVSPRTRITVLTEGLLARRILADPELASVGLVVFDEFHERSLAADFGLALALDARRGLRPDLRLLVMSATLQAESVAARLDHATVVRADGRLFPVETTFLDLQHEPRVSDRVALGVRRALAERDGSVLAFLPGEGEIRACAERLARPGALPASVDLFPLYAALPRTEQDAALRPSPPGRRKVVLATSIAESSLTIDGIACVVDGGLARVSRFSPDTGMSHLETIRLSRDRADQRTGRAGRLGPGFCYRLWNAGEDRRLAPAALPEILSADLAPVVLDCADWGATSPDALPWPTPPPTAAWKQAQALLHDLGALDAHGAITDLGRRLGRLGAHPRLSRMILAAARSGSRESLHEACLLAAALSENGAAVARESANAEHLFVALEEGHASLSSAARARIRDLARSWERAFRDEAPAAGTPLSTGELLAHAYPDRVARRRPLAKDPGRYLLRGGRGVRLRDGDPLAQSDWIVVADVDDADADGTIRLAAPLAASSAMALFSDAFESVDVLEWNERLGRVNALERIRLGAIIVRERPDPAPDPEAVLACLVRGLRTAGLGRLGWSDAALDLRARVAFLRKHAPDEGFPDFSDEALASSLADWLGDRLYGLQTLEQAAEIDLFPPLFALLGPLAARLDEWAPTHLVVPTGSRIRIDYSGDVPTASVRLQETFGLLSTPRLAGGRVPLVLCLLSPAHRPLQTTSDLASFWREGYPLVRKEMRGRYPRHEWPEDPVHATPTRRAKPRSRPS